MCLHRSRQDSVQAHCIACMSTGLSHSCRDNILCGTIKLTCHRIMYYEGTLCSRSMCHCKESSPVCTLYIRSDHMPCKPCYGFSCSRGKFAEFQALHLLQYVWLLVLATIHRCRCDILLELNKPCRLDQVEQGNQDTVLLRHGKYLLHILVEQERSLLLQQELRR